jgi:hypothetical protein
MPIPRSLGRWLRLPSRVALVLGLGALSTAGARADTPDQGDRMAFGDVLIRSEGGRIFLSEGGQETELRLDPTPEREHLLQLLEEKGPAGVKLDPDPRLIMSGGGGAGFSLWDVRRSLADKPAPVLQDPSQAKAPVRSPEQGSAPRDPNPPTKKKG